VSAISPSEREVVLERGRAETNYWRDIWQYRELFLILAWRDVSVRYKQTLIGFAWALIRPFLTMVVFTIVFGRLAKLPSTGDAPYAVMVFAGMLPWFLFSGILTEASTSLVTNANLIGKIYFPRLVIPGATAVVTLVDFGVNLLMLILVLAWYRYPPSWHVVFLPLAVVFAVLASFGPALLVTALNVKYRDFRYVIPFVVQFGLYISPVGFSTDLVPAQWRPLYGLNPVVGIIDVFRWCLVGGASDVSAPLLMVNLGVVAFLLWYGLRYFRRTERTFADLV
jgi:lipopolysaccharide transport system permease protein